ncbi:MAG: hypothetical protein Q9183_003860 [Haloplaca sp. 2 TL-2023]
MNPNSESTGSGGLIDGQSPTSDQQPIPSLPSQEGNGAIQNSGYGSSQDAQRPRIQEASPSSVAEDVDVSTTGSKSNTSISSTDDYVPPVPSNGFDQDEIGSNTNGNAGQTPYISDSNDPNAPEPVLGSASHDAGPSAANSSNALPSNDEVDYGSANPPSGGVVSDGYAGQGTGQSDPAEPAISIVPPFNNASSTMPPVVPPGSDDLYQSNADGMPPYENSIVSSSMPSPTSSQPTIGTRVTSTTTMEVYLEPMTTSSGNAQPPSQSESASEGIYGGKDDSILPTEDGSISPSGSTSMVLTKPNGNGSTPARLESQMPAPHVPVPNSTSPTSLPPPISSPIPEDTSFQPPGDPTQRVPQSSPPAGISDNSQACVPNSDNKYLQASFDILDPALPIPSPYLHLTYSGFNLNPKSPSPHLISQPSKDSPTAISLAADAEHFNLSSVALACAEPPCSITLWGVKVQGKTAQGAASGMLLTKTVEVGVSEEGADEYVTVEGLDTLGWVHLEKVSFVGKKVGAKKEDPPVSVGVDDVLYHVMVRGDCKGGEQGVEGAQIVEELTIGDEGKGNEKNGDEAKGNEKNGDEAKGNEANGDEAKGNEKNGDEADGDEAKGNEGNGNESKGDELNGNEDQGNEANGDEDKGDEDQGNEKKGDEDKGNEDQGNEENGDEWKGQGQAGEVKRFKRRGRIYHLKDF